MITVKSIRTVEYPYLTRAATPGMQSRDSSGDYKPMEKVNGNSVINKVAVLRTSQCILRVPWVNVGKAQNHQESPLQTQIWSHQVPTWKTFIISPNVQQINFKQDLQIFNSMNCTCFYILGSCLCAPFPPLLSLSLWIVSWIFLLVHWASAANLLYAFHLPISFCWLKLTVHKGQIQMS